ncbi:MAG: multiheme c-type cytochrome [Mariprofundaceae bacterium]|nr:multiheme c-type cytochrome [Mariprofundaceae bacterium]
MAASHADMNHYWQQPKATSQQHNWSALEKNMRPEACAQCHESQFNDWKQSLHAEAFSPGMVGQFATMDHGSGNDCLRCHAPLETQLFDTAQAMLASLKTLRKNPIGINQDADLQSQQADLPLRHSGVSCAVCHVRQGLRFGPPRLGSDVQGQIKGDAHGGFIANKRFEQSNFCAECHQFPQSYAINGKPLENTVMEWQQSKFSQLGKQCQSCHMPERRHQFKGIHDKDFTRQGLDIHTVQKGEYIALSITSTNIGHAFPTYVTPLVRIHAMALDVQQQTIKTWHWDLVREVYYDDGWQEKRDTRLFPDETRLFMPTDIPEAAIQLHFQIEVKPDHFYQGMYQSLLEDDMQQDAQVLIKRALKTSYQRVYILYDEVRKLP